MADNDLGFGGSFNLESFKPRPKPKPKKPKPTPNSENVAEKHGFVTREETKRVQFKYRSEPMDNIYIRAPLSVINTFKDYCVNNKYSYGSALEELLNTAAKPD